MSFKSRTDTMAGVFISLELNNDVPFRDLQYSTFCVSHITAKIWLDTILYHDIHSKNNVSLFIEKSRVHN